MSTCDPKGYYGALGVENDATQEQIKQAYKREAKVCHPDKNPQDQSAEQRFKFLSQAYQVLSNPNARALYDSTGSEFLITCPVKNKTGGIFGRRKTPPQCQPREFKDPFSVFESVFSDIGDFEVHAYSFSTPCTSTSTSSLSSTAANMASRPLHCTSPIPLVNLTSRFCIPSISAQSCRNTESKTTSSPPPAHHSCPTNTQPSELSAGRAFFPPCSNPAPSAPPTNLSSTCAPSPAPISPASSCSSISAAGDCASQSHQRAGPLSAIACATANFLQTPGQSTCRVRRLFERKNCVQSPASVIANPWPAGSKVILTALPGQCAKFNGTEATILHYDRLTGNYSLCVKSKTIQLPPHHIRPKEAEVRVVNLPGPIAGKKGKVMGYDCTTDRYHVLMMCGTMFYFSPQNIELPPNTLVQVVVDSIGGGEVGGSRGSPTETAWALIDGLEDPEKYRVRLVDGRFRVVPRNQARLLVATQPQQPPQVQPQPQTQNQITQADHPMQDQ